MHHPTDRITHTTGFVTPVLEHWLEQEIAQWVHHEGSIRRPITPWANDLTTELHLALLSNVTCVCHTWSKTWLGSLVLSTWLQKKLSSLYGIFSSWGPLLKTQWTVVGSSEGSVITIIARPPKYLDHVPVRSGNSISWVMLSSTSITLQQTTKQVYC